MWGRDIRPPGHYSIRGSTLQTGDLESPLVSPDAILLTTGSVLDGREEEWDGDG